MDTVRHVNFRTLNIMFNTEAEVSVLSGPAAAVVRGPAPNVRCWELLVDCMLTMYNSGFEHGTVAGVACYVSRLTILPEGFAAQYVFAAAELITPLRTEERGGSVPEKQRVAALKHAKATMLHKCGP